MNELGQANAGSEQVIMIVVLFQGVLKGTNLRGQTEPKRSFSLIFADLCRFAFPRKQRVWEMQTFAENRRYSQESAENRRNLQKPAFVPVVCPLKCSPIC